MTRWHSQLMLLVAGALTAGGSAAQPPQQQTSRPATGATTEAAAPVEATSELERVLADLARAHGGDEASRAAQSFQGKLSITPTAKKADKITIVLDVRFQTPNLIRYMVDEGERQLERGRDQEGPWARLAAEEGPISLQSRDYEGDRKQLDRHVGLARQLLTYLDPARVARGLQDPVVKSEELRVNRRKTVPCTSISGVTEAFPLYYHGGDPAKAQIKLWVDAATHLLIGVEAFPFDDKGQPSAVGEFIYMPRHGDRGGIQLPVVLVFDQIDRNGRSMPSAKVELRQLDLNPGLDAEKFSRNRPW